MGVVAATSEVQKTMKAYKTNRKFPSGADNGAAALSKQRRASGTFKVKWMEEHIGEYLGVSERAIRFMLPNGRMADGEVTLTELRDRWTATIAKEMGV
jgi:hypothetical protein